MCVKKNVKTYYHRIFSITLNNPTVVTDYIPFYLEENVSNEKFNYALIQKYNEY